VQVKVEPSGTARALIQDLVSALRVVTLVELTKAIILLAIAPLCAASIFAAIIGLPRSAWPLSHTNREVMAARSRHDQPCSIQN
jgi:hypothetical protein